ncbi:MAG: radical SAM protein [Pseudomonadota bacterium]|nr:radical SAM protein [Pseudomonadota bacterium]
MDPYIDPERLDAAHPFTSRKLANMLRGNSEHASRAEIVQGLPVKITLQTTDACNLDCPHCQIPRSQKKPSMSERVLDRVVEELFPTLIELHPTNLGEPFMWRHFERLCREMAHHGVLLDLTTNGTLLDDRRINWVRPIARDLKVSFDGATAATFERLRRGAIFAEVCANVRALVAATPPGVVALQMTLMRSNFREVPALVRLAADLGVSRVKAYHLFSFRPELDAESMVGESEAWPPVLAEALREGERLGVTLQCAEPAGRSDDVGPAACHLPWHETWIDLDGAVLPCHSHGGDTAGNLLDAPFLTAWNGSLYRGIRKAFAADKPTWHCEGCGMNCTKSSEHAPVPYDHESFLSPEGRGAMPASPVRWSARMRQFDLTGRRDGR